MQELEVFVPMDCLLLRLDTQRKIRNHHRLCHPTPKCDRLRLKINTILENV